MIIRCTSFYVKEGECWLIDFVLLYFIIFFISNYEKQVLLI